MRDNLESEDTELLRQKTDALQGAFHKVSEQMYAAAAQQAQAGNGAGADGAAPRPRPRTTRKRSWTPRWSTARARASR